MLLCTPFTSAWSPAGVPLTVIVVPMIHTVSRLMILILDRNPWNVGRSHVEPDIPRRTVGLRRVAPGHPDFCQIQEVAE